MHIDQREGTVCSIDAMNVFNVYFIQVQFCNFFVLFPALVILKALSKATLNVQNRIEELFIVMVLLYVFPTHSIVNFLTNFTF